MAPVTERVLFLVPARGGSRRVPGKNLRAVGGITLVASAVRLGRRVAGSVPGGPHVVACSTDDPEIARVASRWGADIIDRPASLATDTSTSVDVALHALETLGDPAPGRPNATFATLVLLQPTSPLTDVADVLAAIARHRAEDGVAVTSLRRSHPADWHRRLEGDGRLVPVTVDAGTALLIAGAFYVVSAARLRRTHRFVDGSTVGMVVPVERAIDVDEESDLQIAEALLAARPVRRVSIGSREIGGPMPLVIAEAGVNHNGRVELAHQLVDAAADAGADVVKFQTFDPVALAAADAPTAAYQRSAGEMDDQRTMLDRLALPPDAWAGLQAHARERGVVFLSTPFDDASADLLDALDVPAFKVGSGELTNTPFLERLARRGRPLLISTGMAEMVEVAAAVDAVAAAGGPPIALLHCVSSYPARPEDANLRAIETMRRAFGVPVGWSDHTLGIELALAATAVGAALLEKHLTLDRTLPGPDHPASLEPGEFRAMVAGVRATASALGSGVKVPVDAERGVAAVARRSLHWRRALETGTRIDAEDLIALRPASGLAPGRWRELEGRRTARAVAPGSLVVAEDLEAAP